MLEHSAGEMDKAVEHFSSAVTFAEKAGRELELVVAQIGYARALLALGRDDEAAGLLASAHDRAEWMGATKLIARIDLVASGSSGRAREG